MSRKRPRRVSFGLRFLFVLVGLIAVALGRLAWRMRDARMRGDAVVVVQQRLGTVIYECIALEALEPLALILHNCKVTGDKQQTD